MCRRAGRSLRAAVLAGGKGLLRHRGRCWGQEVKPKERSPQIPRSRAAGARSGPGARDNDTALCVPRKCPHQRDDGTEAGWRRDAVRGALREGHESTGCTSSLG